MAEMDTSSGGVHKGPGVKKSKKLSRRVDLTQMVDLSFPTDHVFSSLHDHEPAYGYEGRTCPRMSDKPDDQNKLKESAAFTVMPSKDDKSVLLRGLRIFQTTGYKLGMFVTPSWIRRGEPTGRLHGRHQADQGCYL